MTVKQIRNTFTLSKILCVSFAYHYNKYVPCRYSITASRRQFSKTISHNEVEDKRLPKHVLVKEEVAESGGVVRLNYNTITLFQ